MAGAVLVLDRLVGQRFENRALHLLFMVSAGFAVYAASLLLFARAFVARQIKDFRRLLPGASAKLSSAGA
jgi:hypothetical protein